MQIKSQKDFWSGLMFIGFGVFFALWAYFNYQMGTAVRMGPAYFPTVLGGLLAVLGVLVLIEAFALDAPEGKLALTFNFIDLVVAIAILAVAIWVSRLVGLSSDWGIIAGTLIISVLTIWLRPNAKALVLISAGCVAYGYLMKPLGLVASTAALVFISAFGGHEFKWKEVLILYVVLMIFSYFVFVKGLTLPFPMWPAAFS
jgi:hypothetical protein